MTELTFTKALVVDFGVVMSRPSLETHAQIGAALGLQSSCHTLMGSSGPKTDTVDLGSSNCVIVDAQKPNIKETEPDRLRTVAFYVTRPAENYARVRALAGLQQSGATT